MLPGRRGVFKNTLKASLSKSMWTLGQLLVLTMNVIVVNIFFMDVIMARHNRIDGRANDALH